MKPRSTLDHIAFLVRSLDNALEAMADLKLEAQEVQTFPGEGTRECYLGSPSLASRLLLMEATSAGPYAEALESRGAGVHHVALTTEDLDVFVAKVICKSGWLVHPRSFETRRSSNTIWLARPGVQALVECTEVVELPRRDHVVEQVRIAGLDGRDGLASIFDGVGVEVVAGHQSGVVVDGCFIGWSAA